VCSSDLMAQSMLDGGRLPSMLPIFIGGDGRSGTTLLASMLGAMEHAVVTPESQFKTEIGRYLRADGFDAGAALAAIEASWRFKIWQFALSGEERAEAGRAATWPDLLRFVVQRYAAAQRRPEPRIWIDHTPENIFFIPLLARWFPEARFIHIVRDGRALLASSKQLDWDTKGIAAGGRWWGFVIGQGLAAEHYLPPDKIVRVHYERLVAAPETVLQELCRQLGLDYTPSMTCGDAFTVPAYTRGQHRRIGKPPDLSRIDAWRNELTRRETERFEAATHELLHMLGYAQVFGVAARPSTTAEKLRDLFEELVRKVGVRRNWRRAVATLPRPKRADA